MKFDLESIVRENVKALSPYSSARDEYQGDASVYLDANESPFNTGLNRYPDPYQRELKSVIGPLKNVSTEEIFIGNGSDEAIDLLYRAFCEPGKDKVIITSPTYGMYSVSAGINDVEVVDVPLNEAYELDIDKLQALKNEAKLIFLCSPNNPTGNSIPMNQIELIAGDYNGVVVVDEAYIDFSEKDSTVSLVGSNPNVVVLQTLSKAWGLAGIRLGLAIGNPEIISVLNKIKPPYNVNGVSQKIALEAIKNKLQKDSWVKAVLAQKSVLLAALERLPAVLQVWASDTNFILFKVNNPDKLYEFLLRQGIVIRNRSRVAGCEGCLRVSVGTMEENLDFLEKMNDFNKGVSQ